MSPPEYERKHTGGIDFEKKIFDLVKNGDVNGIKKILDGFTPDASDFGEVAVNSAKQQIDIFAVSPLSQRNSFGKIYLSLHAYLLKL